MTRRWKDRITILLLTAKTYDAWGHLLPLSWQPTSVIWADVRPILGTTVTAIVTVRAPFEYVHDIRISWQDKLWKILQAPLEFPHSGLIQLKIEQI